jgi:hypothetical protein
MAIEEKHKRLPLNPSEFIEKALASGESLDGLAAKTQQFVENVQNLFKCIQNLYEDISPELLAVSQISVTCNLNILGKPKATVCLGSQEDILLSITGMLNRVTDAITGAESEKSESDSSTTRHQDCTDDDQ